MLKYLFIKLIIVCSVIANAQVHARDEPRHHNVFENEYIRILDAFLGPKDTTQYHLHNTASVFIILADCNVSSQLLGGKPQPGANVSGSISYDAMKTERIHRVWNEDTLWFHVMDIELTSKNQKNAVKVIQHASLKLLFNEPEVNGYEAGLTPGAHLALPASASGYLVVSKTAASIDLIINKATQQRLMKAGHYAWIEPGNSFTIRSKETKPMSFVILQLK